MRKKEEKNTLRNGPVLSGLCCGQQTKPSRICSTPPSQNLYVSFLTLSWEALSLGDSQSDALSSVATVNTQPVAVGHGRSLTTSAVQGQCTLLETPQLSSSIFTAGCSVQFYVSGPASGLLVFEECQVQPQKFLCAGNIFCYWHFCVWQRELSRVRGVSWSDKQTQTLFRFNIGAENVTRIIWHICVSCNTFTFPLWLTEASHPGRVAVTFLCIGWKGFGAALW